MRLVMKSGTFAAGYSSLGGAWEAARFWKMKGGGGRSHLRSLRPGTFIQSSGSPFTHSLPRRPARSHYVPWVWLVRATFQPGIYVARRWPCCRGSGRQVACLRWEAGSDGGGSRGNSRVGRAQWDSPLLLRSVVRLSFAAALKHN